MNMEIIVVKTPWTLSAITSAKGPLKLLGEGLAERLQQHAEVRVTSLGSAQSPTVTISDEFDLAGKIGSTVGKALEESRFPLVLSGSCLAGLGGASAIGGERRGVVWLDCHGDFNSAETTGSGRLDGMVTSTLVGRSWRKLLERIGAKPIEEASLLLVGVRDLDPEEATVLSESEVSRADVGAAVAELKALASRCDSLYLHIDLDVLDPEVGMANRFSRPGGFTIDGFLSFMESAAREPAIKAIGVASYDPDAAREGRVCEAALDGLDRFFEARAAI